MTRYLRTAPFAGALLACAIQSQMASAQGFLEEVVVTAEKRESTLQDTALAVSAFTNEELERGLINNNMDIQMKVPNMLMSKGFFTTANISIRGVGNAAVGAQSDAGTGVHFNGVYLNNARIFETEYFDTERVEVLRGPQGTLYGRNTTAGVINVISKKPEEEFGGNIDLSYGDENYVRVRGALNIPITDNLWQRFSVFYTERDGIVDNIYNGDDIDGRDMYSVRSSTTWNISDNTDATLVINYFDEDSDRMRGSGNYCKKDPDGILGCLPNQGLPSEVGHTGGTVGGLLLGNAGPLLGTTFDDDQNANSINPSDRRKVNMDFNPAYEADETIISLEINHDFGDYTFHSLTGYHESSLDARNDYDQTVPSDIWDVETTVDRGPDGEITVDYLYQNDRSTTEPEQWSQEFRLNSNFDGDHNFMAGAFYLEYESEAHFYVYSAALTVYGQAVEGTFLDDTAGPRDQWVFDNDTKKYQLDTWAIFGEYYWDITDDMELTLGIRYTDETKESDQRTIYLGFQDNNSDPNQGYQNFKDDWQETTGKANLSYHLNEDVMLFATLARSYKSGGANPISSNSPCLLSGDCKASFEPEYINSVEIGAKSRWFDNTFQANVTAFYYDYEDLQVSKIVNQTSLNENVGATIMGFEGEFTWAPTENWTFSTNLSWLDTELDSFADFDTADPNQMGTTQDIVSAGNFNIYEPCGCEGLDVDMKGNELQNAPEWSVNISAGYGFFMENGMRIDLSTSYYWQDEFYSRIYNTQDDLLEEWDVWNAAALLTSADDVWFAEGWVRNINDDENITGQYLQDPAVGMYRTFQLLEPRTYGVTVGYNF